MCGVRPLIFHGCYIDCLQWKEITNNVRLEKLLSIAKGKKLLDAPPSDIRTPWARPRCRGTRMVQLSVVCDFTGIRKNRKRKETH